MDIKAKEKQKSTRSQKVVEQPPNEKTKSYSYPITIQCNTLLYTTMQNKVEAMHATSDFTYTSVTDLIRAAIKAYKEGMELTELEQKGKKKQTSIRLEENTYNFYKELPDQMKTKIIERAIRTFLKERI
ncbi:hypothetical protein [Myxosarcina sp. GI1]|uniref:hypothetical protein n=1 Tax=Myxosarcina sp. GI1 TaxID=1541065 RepID=UPI00055B266C|nr:hypothetical protein [Myxosarcina sp. GI1]